MFDHRSVYGSLESEYHGRHLRRRDHGQWSVRPEERVEVVTAHSSVEMFAYLESVVDREVWRHWVGCNTPVHRSVAGETDGVRPGDEEEPGWYAKEASKDTIGK